MKRLNARKLFAATALLLSAATISPTALAVAQEPVRCVVTPLCDGYWTTIYLIIPVYVETCQLGWTCS